MTLHTITKGHRRLLDKMGFPYWLRPETAEQWLGLGEEERVAALLVAIWVLSVPVEDVVPGGKIASAVQAGAWRRYFEEWEFSLTDEVEAGLPAAFARAIGNLEAAPARSTIPGREPGPAPATDEEEEACEACQ